MQSVLFDVPTLHLRHSSRHRARHELRWSLDCLPYPNSPRHPRRSNHRPCERNNNQPRFSETSFQFSFPPGSSSSQATLAAAPWLGRVTQPGFRNSTSADTLVAWHMSMTVQKHINIHRPARWRDMLKPNSQPGALDVQHQRPLIIVRTVSAHNQNLRTNRAQFVEDVFREHRRDARFHPPRRPVAAHLAGAGHACLRGPGHDEPLECWSIGVVA